MCISDWIERIHTHGHRTRYEQSPISCHQIITGWILVTWSGWILHFPFPPKSLPERWRYGERVSKGPCERAVGLCINAHFFLPSKKGQFNCIFCAMATNLHTLDETWIVLPDFKSFLNPLQDCPYFTTWLPPQVWLPSVAQGQQGP